MNKINLIINICREFYKTFTNYGGKQDLKISWKYFNNEETIILNSKFNPQHKEANLIDFNKKSSI